MCACVYVCGEQTDMSLSAVRKSKRVKITRLLRFTPLGVEHDKTHSHGVDVPRAEVTVDYYVISFGQKIGLHFTSTWGGYGRPLM